MFSKKKPAFSALPVQRSTFQPRGWSKPDTGEHSEQQLPDLQTIRDNYAKRPSFINNISVSSPQQVSLSQEEEVQPEEANQEEENLQAKSLGQVQLEEAEEENPEELQAKPLTNIQRQEEANQEEENLQAKSLGQVQLEEAEDENPEGLQAKPLTNIQRQEEANQEDEHLQPKFLGQVQLQEAEEENPEELQAKPLTNIQRQEEANQEEENLQAKSLGQVQLQEAEEENPEGLQAKPLTNIQRQEEVPQEEENLQAKSLGQVQLEEAEEENPEGLQAKPLTNIQRQEEANQEEENLQAKSLGQVQLEEAEEENPEGLQAKPLTNIQRQEEANQEEENLQAKSLGQVQLEEAEEENPEDLQTKLTVGAPGDKYEQEADHMAAKVMAMPEPETPQLIQREMGEEEEVQMKPLAKSITPLIQRKSNKGFSASPNVESNLYASKGSGSPLGDNVRDFMESRFGADFGSVRVHTGSTAVQMNKELGAQAFTHGNDIYYGAGKSPGNNELTAHELTHTIQQTGARKLNNKAINLQLKNRQKENNKSEHKKQANRFNYSSLNKEVLNKNISSFESENNTKFTEESFPTITKLASEKGRKSHTNFHPPQLNKETLLKNKPVVTVNTPKLKIPEIGSKETASFETTPGKNQPQTDITKTPKNLSATQVTPTNTTTTGKQENSPPTAEVLPTPAPLADTTSAPESIGDTAESAAEGDSPQVGDDKELESIATTTEGVELEADDRANAMTSLAEVSDSGGSAAGGGGGGGGAAIADKPVPTVPDVSQAEPSQALAAISQLPPAQLQAGLSSVTTAVGNTVSKEKAELAANVPQMECPSGSPITKEGSTGNPDPAAKTPKPMEKAPQGPAHPVPQPQPLPPLPPPPVQSVPQPQKDPQSIKASLDNLPTRDPGLNVTAGSPPPLELKGDADPQQTQEQKAKLEKSVADSHAQGQQELAQPMGEDEIYPNVPKETLKAEPIGGGAVGGAAVGDAKGAECEEGVSIIAQQEHGQEIQSAVAQAQGQIASQRQEHTNQVAQEKEKSNKEITKLQSESETQQTQERAKAHTEVSQQREAWNKEQTTLVEKSRKDGDAAVAKGIKDVQQEQTQAETKANQCIEQGNQEAETARKEGEQQAAAEKSKGEKESGGIFGWLADKAQAFFDGIKQAIQKAFEIARAAVKAAIDTAKKLATAVIEAARNAIVSVIKAVGEALIAIGDVLLAAFPGLRDRFRNAIKSVVQKAEAAVNFLANKLKQGVQAALNLLGKGLNAALGLMEKGMLLAVDAANAATKNAISAAKAAVETLGTFAVLAKDIATNPGQWLSNLGAGAMDGIKNHLWTAFQAAIKEWFNQKVEQVLGLGLTIWKVLSQGGINLAEVGKMAWEGIKAAIPPALIQILIEKLVAMIVPAAGAVLAIIEGLQAAWGTASRILQAMERFMTFLKAVKSGQSGPQFGALLAAAGVVLVDFVSNWLLKRVAGAASKVGNKIREIAKRIGKRLKRTFVKLKKRVGNLKDKFLGKNKINKGKKQKASKEKEKQQQIQERIEKVKHELPPKIHNLLAKKPSKLRVLGQFAIWRIAYKLRRLQLEGTKGKFKIIAQVNPTIDLADGWTFDAYQIFSVVDKIASEYIAAAEVSKENTSITLEEPAEPISLESRESGIPSVALRDRQAYRDRAKKTEESSPVISQRGTSTTHNESTNPNFLDLREPGNALTNLRHRQAYLIGTTHSGTPLGYKHQPAPINKTWGEIAGLESSNGHYYPTLKKKLAGVEVGEMFTKILHGKPLPDDLPQEQKEAIGELFGLWYAKEPSHPRGTQGHRRDLVYSLMITQLMTPEEGKQHLNIKQGIDLHPASFGKVQGAAKRVTSEMVEGKAPPREGTKIREKRDERYRREKDTIKAWFKSNVKDLPVLEKEPTIADVETFVRQQLQKYLKRQ
jgi:hypothetical protein